LFTAAAAVFVEVAKRRTLRDIKLSADAMPYTKSEADYISYHAANFEENADLGLPIPSVGREELDIYPWAYKVLMLVYCLGREQEQLGRVH
jgi:hypothetical protein